MQRLLPEQRIQGRQSFRCHLFSCIYYSQLHFFRQMLGQPWKKGGPLQFIGEIVGGGAMAVSFL